MSASAPAVPTPSTPVAAFEGLATTVSRLASTVTELAPAAADLEATTTDALDAEADVVDAAIALVRPLLPHLARAIRSSWTGTSTDGLCGTEQWETFPLRGLVLAGSLRTAEGGHNDTRGSISGQALVLWSDGSLADVYTTGMWTRWDRESPWLTRTAVPTTAREAVEGWEVDDLLKCLARECDRLRDVNLPQQAASRLAWTSRLNAACAVLNGTSATASR